MAAEAIIGPTSFPLSLEANMETPTGGVVLSISVILIRGQKKSFQCVKIDKIAKTAMEGQICGTKILHSVYHWLAPSILAASIRS